MGFVCPFFFLIHCSLYFDFTFGIRGNSNFILFPKPVFWILYIKVFLHISHSKELATLPGALSIPQLPIKDVQESLDESLSEGQWMLSEAISSVARSPMPTINMYCPCCALLPKTFFHVSPLTFAHLGDDYSPPLWNFHLERDSRLCFILWFSVASISLIGLVPICRAPYPFSPISQR